MASIQSVNSNVTSNTFNTCNTGDGTVQASNKKIHQRRRRPSLGRRGVFKSTSPRIIEEEPVYDLSGSSDESPYVKKLSSSSSSAKNVGGAGVTTAPKSTAEVGNTREIKYDLSGMKSNEEMRDDLQKSFSQLEMDALKEAVATSGVKGSEDQAWYSFLFCVNNDTTSDTNTLGTLESEATLSVVDGTQPPKYDLSGGTSSKTNRPSSRGLNRFSSVDTDAALLSRSLRDPAVVSSSARSKRQTPPKSSMSSPKPPRPTDAPPSPTRLKEGAGSLDIVMELQLEEDLLINAKGSKKKEKKGGFRKKIKGHKRSNSKSKNKADDNLLVHDDEAVNSPAGDMGSVMSERSIFSFGTEAPEINVMGGTKKSPSSSPSRLGAMRMTNKYLCITGPANGTFINISSAKDAEHPELSNTYKNFRVHDKGIEMVLSRIGTSIPLYHWTGANSQSFKFGDINMSVSSEDLGLSSFSHLNLTSSSMRSTSEISIVVDVNNVCSEPSSKGFLVRGPTYMKDAKKVPSGETMFSLLGADSIVKGKGDTNYVSYDVCKVPDSYLAKITAKSKRLGLKPPFLIVINFVVPWGNFLSYYYRPDANNGGPYCDSRKNHASEKLWRAFLGGDETFRNDTLKFIPKILEGPWALKKLVGTQPAIIGQKIPTSYYGSAKDGYIEICMDVTRGGKMANSICSAVASKASLLSMDLAFLLQGSNDEELPEQLLTAVRLHHVSLKKKKAGRIEI